MRRSALACALIAALSAPCGAEPRRTAAEIMDILMWAREPVGGGGTSVTTRSPPSSAVSTSTPVGKVEQSVGDRKSVV